MHTSTAGLVVCCLLSCLMFACGDDDDGVPLDDAGGDAAADTRPGMDTAPPPPIDAGPAVIAERPSRSGSIAVNDAGDTIAVANKGTDDVTFFNLADGVERARVAVGREPTALVFHPGGDRLFVLNAADGTVSEISGADTDAPSIRGTHAVGPEPMGAALSPSGRFLYVSSWTGGSLHIVDTSAATVQEVRLGGAPYAVCVTNDRDEDDSDETVYVTDFYSRAGAGREGTDGSRRARVFRLDAAGALQGEVTLSPVLVKGIEPEIDAAATSAFPNQLYACAIAEDHLYVTAVGASPAAFEGGTNFRQNVHGLVHAISLASNTEVPARTTNLSELVSALEPPKRFTAIPVSIDFVAGTELAYIASMASDSVLRVSFEGEPFAGSPSGATFLETDKQPTGIAISGTEAFVNNEVSRSMSRIDLATQTTLARSIPSAPQPANAGERQELLGQRFFTTGLARWSTGAWVSCASCHPNGTTDNVTWVFPAGPRQTVDTAATFDVSGSVQRILNWTAIFDEVHDFELNTRGVAGGVGAIVSNAELDPANRINFVGPGGVADPQNGFNVGSARAVALSGATPEDWDAIEAYIRTLRSPHGAPSGEGDPDAGRDVFESAGCQNCHGGALWTLSERYYTPLLNGDLRTLTLAEAGVASVGDVRADQLSETDTSAIRVLQNDSNGPPQRHSCVVRDVGTFAAGARGADEIRQNGGNAQGVDGFNVPSLINTGLGAPYLHNGGAETLEDLLDPDGEFVAHLRAGNQVFTPSDEDIRNLVAFLETIDDETEIIPVPEGQQFCPVGVRPPLP